jgi:hypothetical protein
MGMAREKDCTGFHGEGERGASATWRAQREKVGGLSLEAFIGRPWLAGALGECRFVQSFVPEHGAVSWSGDEWPWPRFAGWGFASYEQLD